MAPVVTPSVSGGSRQTPVKPAPSLASGPDLTRRPSLAGGLEWDCAFPPEADAAGVDSAVVSVRVDVEASGAVRGVSIESDPGRGFGRAARRCAETKQWTPALDRGGHPIDGSAAVHVRFTR
jgi:protein TonB